MNSYAGIGSRETPLIVLSKMENLGKELAASGWILRTGNAKGADQAFASGANKIAPESVELYLPWDGYELEAVHPLNKVTIGSLRPVWSTILTLHPNSGGLTRGATRLHARNVYIIKGADLITPVRFVICWTRGGKITGGTGMGIRIAWPEGPVCPHCQEKNVTRLEPKSKSVRDGVFQCNVCRGQFSVLLGTIMQGSHITLRQWVQAFHSMCSHKKGVSALQLQRNLGLKTYKSAWHLAHRIRLAMRQGPLVSALRGTVEVDETYIGGKPRKGDGKVHKRGRGTEKTPVLALVERDGRVRTGPIENVTAKTLKGAIRENVSREARIVTDELPTYGGIGAEFAGGHETVNHGQGEYARGDVNTNSAESFFALLKRGVHGTFHHISKKHLHRYCDEFAFRWDYRKISDGERATAAIRGCEGKRLAYQTAGR